ncbi:Hydroxyproline O-arabinosyltransferase RDN2 [Sesamum angolense]|uniref:Hydroxyproline O-arabinosyltransferase RDN2 n=1 Tax=Sesamum angolense TaxID=2727404 RepID=A0AAE2C283_9LAMI|nr:Hydroxyproline O-arabinosyltransferase RDN2 [Sesamum angolense]
MDASHKISKNPLNFILEANKFDGTNYLNWMRNLRITLNFENQTYVLDKSLPRTLPKWFMPGERLTLEKFTQWHKDNQKVCSIVLSSTSNEIQKQYKRYAMAKAFFSVRMIEGIPVEKFKDLQAYFDKEETYIDDLLERIAPTWLNVSLNMKHDPETDHTFGWVLEMYGYAVASALHGVQHILRKDFMFQPPWDLETANKFILHYTYGCDYNLKGELTYGKIGEWQFDKRTYLDGPPPRNLSLPPPGVPESVVTLINLINEATANLPNWDDVLTLQLSSIKSLLYKGKHTVYCYLGIHRP